MSTSGPIKDRRKKMKRKRSHSSDSDSDDSDTVSKKHKKTASKNKIKKQQKNKNKENNDTRSIVQAQQQQEQERVQVVEAVSSSSNSNTLVEHPPITILALPMDVKDDVSLARPLLLPPSLNVNSIINNIGSDATSDIPPLPTLVNSVKEPMTKALTVSKMDVQTDAMTEIKKSDMNGHVPITVLEGPSIAILLWRHFRNVPDKTLFIEQVIMDRITWPSLANSLYSTQQTHFEIETRMGVLKTPKGKRFRLPSPGPHVIEHAYVAKHKLSFAPNISARAYDALKRDLLLFINSNQYTTGILTDEAIESKHECRHYEVRDYGEDIRRIDDMDTKQYHWQQKKQTSPNIEVSMRTAGAPSTDIRFSTCSEKVLTDSDVGLSIDELETRWNSKRDKYFDRFIIGHFAIDMAICTIHERIRSPTGEYLGEQLEPDLLRTVEVELLYKPEQLDRVLERRKAVITQQLHISRALAAYLAHADSVMAMIT